ncbi:MAG: hypothetical protein ACPGOS_04310, partial [Gammaproteobacteria bacterium]
MIIVKRSIRTVGALFVALAIGMPLSYSTDTLAQTDVSAIEEITVTARQREESLADAPYTITALTADQLEVRGINQLQDVVA